MKDPPLSESGKKLVSNIDLEYDLVITSTLKRTQETLTYSKIKYKDTFSTHFCREFMCNGLPDYLECEDLNYEPHESVISRMNEFRRLLNDLRTKYDRILVISHGIFLGQFLKLTRGLNNCDIVMEYQDKHYLLTKISP